ncbi:39S ribosomal protein L37, mitochondrial [Thalassophryne amazonica]|uniref:39S ribosomal protein L37, mitochondrial n=1 Tax=Thalassophryne amazonica TaxID=390379 RepID=UPI0014723753|nr:39S ribosomal protein L37, mitochondrial [Thalassophryne amazonica]XP_034038592.1 39S ribosomal protein L37, mitochondrial [Thalassophryne amazonica]
MFSQAARRVERAAPGLSSGVLLKDLVFARGRTSSLQAQRHFGGSCCLTAKKLEHRPIRTEIVEIPGLEKITYGARMYFVPGLAKPVYPPWQKDYTDPNFHRPPPPEDMPLHKDKPCYIFHQTTNLTEGVHQALWLTKAKLTSGLPPHLLSLANDPTNQIPDQDERVQNAIRHARFWDTTESRPDKDKYSCTLLTDLLHLCGTLQQSHPTLGRRILAQKYLIAASWKRGDDLFQVRGLNGLLQNSRDPLPPLSDKQGIASTVDHILETFYPVSPNIDLQQTNVYMEDVNSTGFREGYPYPHAHTLFFAEGDEQCKLKPEQFRAKMVMFAFGNALARAHILYGTQPQQVLDRPITVQAVGTNGRVFHFVVFQLNTTDLSGDDGVKNEVWMDKDVELYKFAKVRPYIKRKEVKVPAGLAGYQPETFSKFLALYLHGAV